MNQRRHTLLLMAARLATMSGCMQRKHVNAQRTQKRRYPAGLHGEMENAQAEWQEHMQSKFTRSGRMKGVQIRRIYDAAAMAVWGGGSLWVRHPWL